MNTKSSLQGFLRDWGLWAIQLSPKWKHQLEQGSRAEGPVKYSHRPGLPFLPDLNGGICFPQTYCAAVADPDCIVRFTDDVIFAASKEKLFQVVVLLHDTQTLWSVLSDLAAVKQDCVSLVSYREATIFAPRSCFRGIDDKSSRSVDGRVYRPATAEEFGRSNLCHNRPHPRGYNEDLMWQICAGKPYIIVRPDRFVFAMCSTAAELEMAAKQLEEMFS